MKHRMIQHSILPRFNKSYVQCWLPLRYRFVFAAVGDLMHWPLWSIFHELFILPYTISYLLSTSHSKCNGQCQHHAFEKNLRYIWVWLFWLRTVCKLTITSILGSMLIHSTLSQNIPHENITYALPCTKIM